jgi:hypothetical protein
MALVAAPISADAGFEVVQGDFIGLNNGPGSSGGVFHVDVDGRGTTADFDTFCVELEEHITFKPTTYYVESIGLWTKEGDRKLGAQSAWLYTQFLKENENALVGFDFDLVAGNPSSTQAKKQADALQLGIWRGMVDGSNNPNPYSDYEIKTLAGWSYSYISDLTTNYLGGWLQKFSVDNTWSGTGNIQIMNLRTFAFSSTGPITLPDGRKIKLKLYAQDQLVCIDPHVAPELPSFYSACTVVSCALVFSLITYVRRRKASPAI